MLRARRPSEGENGLNTHYPKDETEVAGLVRDAAAAAKTIRILGGGTRSAIGHPVEADRVLSLGHLSGITLYEPAALTLVARAGTPLAEIEATLEGEGQMLPFEPADYRALLASSGEPTLGGMFAAGLSGPRRIQTGACRDAAIGVRFVDGSGEILKSGGRVMKNVTGYDLVKLQCGAWGTLGVVTEIAFKLLPKPETTTTLVLRGLDDVRAIEALSKALASPFGVSGAAHLPGDRTLVRVEGFVNSVAHRAESLRSELSAFGDAEALSDAADNKALWAGIANVEVLSGKPGSPGSGAVWRVSLKPSDGPKLVAELRRALDVEAVYDWGGGLVWLLVPQQGDAGASLIRKALSPLGGHATLIRAGGETRRTVPVFQPETPTIAAISAGLRQQFDPKGILNPGLMDQ
ncbi:MAG: glycolate oxidase subunit GlcE [Nitratireductor sp.]|nr:glycolate oxidase subunit GlcE [Nitratireductor sp.]